MNWNQHNGLQFLENVSGSARSAVVIFHGYGADAHDLASLASTADPDTDWYFPQGVLEVPIGPGMTGRGWFSIENRDWDALHRGEISDVPFTPAILHTLKTVIEFLNTVGERYDNVILGGFSQGAILTSHVFHRTQFAAKGLVLLSGYLVSPSEYPTLSPLHANISFMQSHGRDDEVLPLAGAKKLRSHLTGMGLKGDLQVFEGSHEIPLEIQSLMKKFIKNRLAMETPS